MQEIKCPNCGEVFQVDESGYAQIVQQVRDKEFNKELERRTAEYEEKKASDITIIKMEQAKDFQTQLSAKDGELAKKEQLIAELQQQLSGKNTEKDLAVTQALQTKEKESMAALKRKEDALLEKDKEIQQLKAQLDKAATEKELAVTEAVNAQEKLGNSAIKEKEDALLAKEKEIQDLKAKLDKADTEKNLAVTEAVNAQEKYGNSIIQEKVDTLNKKNDEIRDLKAQLANAETQKELAITQTIQQKDQELASKATEISDLNNQLSLKESESKLKEQTLKDSYEKMLKMKDEEIEHYKEFKARQSTKMIGESLEQHCLNEFNSHRMGSFPTAYFEKDNDARTGSKGDFIFRESDEEGTEYISIMFEMKNEMDTTTTKHKNEDFFKELDKDRKEKNCEYAVLVSLLEADNEYYNNGIVDVSYRYDKMYVIRPQFFIPMITLLRNAARSSLKYRKKLQVAENQQLDVKHFEENMQQFKDAFGRNYELASRKFKDAIDDIDKTIRALEKTKADLLSSENNLRLANNKAQDLSIKKLTKNAPSVRKAIEDAKFEEE